MFLRLLFVLLAILNIVACSWLFLGQPYVHVPAPTDPGIPELHLLSELPAPTVSASVPARPASTPAPATTSTVAANTSDTAASTLR